MKERFAAEYNCNRVKIRSLGYSNSSYIAEGCGYSATYTCTTGNDRIGIVQDVCIRESDNTPRQTVVSSPAPARQRATVERKYDETRKLETVVGSFSTERNVSLVLAGAPGASLGEVSVELRIPRYLMKADCGSLEVLINDVPSPGTQFSTSSKHSIHASRARFDFQTFKPLAQQFSTLGARACGYEAKLDEHTMDDVKKFFVIYSQIASELAQPEQAAPATATEL